MLSVLMLVENLDITARWDAATWTQGSRLHSALLPPSFVWISPFFVKMFSFILVFFANTTFVR